MRPRRRVLVVDDSAVVRLLMTEVLREARIFDVETAADPLIALRKIGRRRPDVLLLDVEMPRMNGLDLLRELADTPIPAVILSSHTPRGARLALEAFDLGAVEVLAKPPYGLEQFLRYSATELVEVLRTAALPGETARRRASGRSPSARGATGAGGETRSAGSCRIIAVGASTGGPQALARLLGHLPADAPGLVIAQHMPPGFTTALARRLDQVGPLEVREAEDGAPIKPGTVLVAPGDRHLQVTGCAREMVARLWSGPPVQRHRPSVDVLFDSVLQAAGASAAAVLLSGMGADGARAMLRLRRAGAFTLAQDEASCAVYGMPQAARRAGAVEATGSPEELAEQIARRHAEARRRRDLRARLVPDQGVSGDRSAYG